MMLEAKTQIQVQKLLTTNPLNWRALILVLSGLLLFSVSSQAQYKPWSTGSPLVWSDFQGTPPPLSTDPHENHDAFVYTEIRWDFTWDQSTRTLEVNAQAVFGQAESWYRPAAATPALLTHEIGHFDYAEVGARQLKQRIAESVELKDLLRRCDVTESEIDAMLTAYHAEEIDELIFNHGFYDSETEHSLNVTQQNIFTGTTIPGLLTGLNAYADPTVTVSVENEGAVPVPGTYEGVLRYTIQGGPDNFSIASWNLTIEGQWNFTLTADATNGDSSWEHEYTNHQYGGHLIDVTMPPVPSIPSMLVQVEEGPSGKHFWLNPSTVPVSTIESHVLTMAPVTGVPVALPSTPPNTTIPFVSGAALALGHWMNEQGVAPLKMRAPITCPNESIVYHIDMGSGQYFEFEWTMTRIATPQDSTAAGGAGGSGSSSVVDISSIIPDMAAGTVTLSWEAPASGTNYLIESSEDLLTWTEVATVASTSTGTTTYVDTDSLATSSSLFYRVTVVAP